MRLCLHHLQQDMSIITEMLLHPHPDLRQATPRLPKRSSSHHSLSSPPHNLRQAWSNTTTAPALKRGREYCPTFLMAGLESYLRFGQDRKRTCHRQQFLSYKEAKKITPALVIALSHFHLLLRHTSNRQGRYQNRCLRSPIKFANLHQARLTQPKTPIFQKSKPIKSE